MIYPYLCDACGPFEVVKSMSRSSRPEPCPECGGLIKTQDFSAKSINGFISTEGDWSGGKLVPQLGVGHPDSMVTSKTQMEKVYRKHGISLDTGHFTSREAQIQATVPRKKQTPHLPSKTVVGGVMEDK